MGCKNQLSTIRIFFWTLKQLDNFSCQEWMHTTVEFINHKKIPV